VKLYLFTRFIYCIERPAPLVFCFWKVPVLLSDFMKGYFCTFHWQCVINHRLKT